MDDRQPNLGLPSGIGPEPGDATAPNRSATLLPAPTSVPRTTPASRPSPSGVAYGQPGPRRRNRGCPKTKPEDPKQPQPDTKPRLDRPRSFMDDPQESQRLRTTSTFMHPRRSGPWYALVWRGHPSPPHTRSSPSFLPPATHLPSPAVQAAQPHRAAD